MQDFHQAEDRMPTPGELIPYPDAYLRNTLVVEDRDPATEAKRLLS